MFSLKISTEPATLVTVTLVLLCLLLYRYRSRQSTTPPRPPCIIVSSPPHRRDTYLTLRTRHGPNFHLIHPTHSSIYIGDALTIKDVLDRPDRFPVGALHISSAPMWRLSPQCALWFAASGGQLTLKHSSQLFSGTKLSLLQGRYVDALSRQLKSVREGKEGDVIGLVSGIVFQATMEALFTPCFPKGVYGEFRRWDAELHRFCSGTPSKSAIEARDRFYKIVSEQLWDHLEECSTQAREQFQAAQTHQTHADAAALVLRTAWLGATQTPLAAVWLVCILAQHPEKVARIRKDVQELKERLVADKVEDLARKPEWLKELPLLDRLVKEVLRVFCKQSVPRVCAQDTTVKALDGGGKVKQVQLKQGDVLQLVFWCVHDGCFSPQWWPETQAQAHAFRGTRDAFDETRFEPDRHPAPSVKLSNTAETVRTWMPFGYGCRICPGRYWAVAEIKAFVLMFLDSFDLASPGKMPRPDPTRWIGVLSPLDAMSASITARS